MHSALSDLLTDKQHGGFIALPLANHDFAVDLQIVKRGTHGINGGLVGFFFITAPDKVPSRDRGNFGHADSVEDQATIKNFRTHLPISSAVAAIVFGFLYARDAQQSWTL